jgi:hypothetical protein
VNPTSVAFLVEIFNKKVIFVLRRVFNTQNAVAWSGTMSSLIHGPYIRGTVLITFRDEIKRYGGDPTGLLQVAGLPVEAMNQTDSFISGLSVI